MGLSPPIGTEMNPYRKQADHLTKLIDEAATGEEANDLTRQRRRYLAAADLIEANPHVVITEAQNGEVMIDMSRATEHPGKWGHRLVACQARRAPKTWVLPPHDYQGD